MFLDRASLKREAKVVMSKKFGQIFLVVLCFMFFTNILWSILANISTLDLQDQINNILAVINDSVNTQDIVNALNDLTVVMQQLSSKIAIFGVIAGFLLMAFQLSYTAYFIKVSKGGDAEISSFFKEIKGKRLLDSILLMLLIEVKVFLWSLLFIIPGIIKTFSYMLAQYIKAENPDMKLNDAIKKSCEIMDGKKGFVFVLSLSFIGWAILASFADSILTNILAMFIGNVTVYTIVTSIINMLITASLTVYVELTIAKFYLKVNPKRDVEQTPTGFSFFKNNEPVNNNEVDNTESTTVEEVDETKEN